MGRLRALNRQHRRVLDDDSMWRIYAPQALSPNEPLRDAFIARTERRTVQGNALLAEAYATLPESQYHAAQAGFLLLGPYGRDEDYDAATALRAPPAAWQFFSQIVRNDSAIVGRAFAMNVRVLPYLGKSMQTSSRIDAALEVDGLLIRHLGLAVQSDCTRACKAIRSSGFAYAYLAPSLKRDRDVALLQVRLHPTQAESILPLFCNERAFFTPAVVSALPRFWSFDRFAGPQLLQDREFLLEVMDAWTCPSVYKRLGLHDDAPFMQAIWQKSYDFERSKIKNILGESLVPRWHLIDTPDFLVDP